MFWMTIDKNDSATALIVSPENLIPIPKVTGSAKRANRRRIKTAVIIDLLYKKELEDAIKAKNKGDCQDRKSTEDTF